jgi:hypothetical protein
MIHGIPFINLSKTCHILDEEKPRKQLPSYLSCVGKVLETVQDPFIGTTISMEGNAKSFYYTSTRT